MSDATNSTEDVRPETTDMSEEPTIAAGLHADSDSDTATYPFAGDDAAFQFDGAESEPGEDDEWPVRAPAKGIRLGIPAALMLAVALVAAGFWGGAIAQKNHGTASAATGAAAFAARLRNAAGTGANGGDGGFQLPGATGTGGSSDTTGTISVVSGNTLYVLTATNQLVEVKLTPSTTVTRNAKTKPVQLRPGDTVVVQGAARKGGRVQASSVAATAKGVSPTTGGLGGGFAPGGTGGSSPQGAPGG
jgi:hypothetical protein